MTLALVVLLALAQSPIEPCGAVQQHYAATVERVIDGDSYVLSVSLGFGVSIRVAVRLRGIDTPELPTPEGLKAKAAAETLLRSGLVTIKPTGQQTFARWVSDVFVGGQSLAVLLRAGGYGQ